MKKMESTYRESRSDASKCEAALLLIRDQTQRDLEEGRITADQFVLIDKRLEQYLKELIERTNLMSSKRSIDSPRMNRTILFPSIFPSDRSRRNEIPFPQFWGHPEGLDPVKHA